MCSSKKLLPLRSSSRRQHSQTLNARPQIRGSPQLPVTVSNYRVCVFGYDDSIQPRQVDTKKLSLPP